MKFMVRHAIVASWLLAWMTVAFLKLGIVMALCSFALLAPLYWQLYVKIKEDIHELRERAGLSGEPAPWEAADAQGDKPERTKE